MQLVVIIVILIVSLTFALIGITTNYWYESLSNEYSEGLWFLCHRQLSKSNSSLNNEICNKLPYSKSQSLAIIGIILLFIAIILSTIRRYRQSDRSLAYLIIVTLSGSTLMIIFSYLLHPRQINLRQFGYSIYFMLISSLLILLTTGLVAFSTRTIQ